MGKDHITTGGLMQRGDAQDGRRSRALAQVLGYWEALRKGRTVPPRAEIDPRGIEQALEFAFIAERIAPGMARFRLAGMHLSDLMGMEVRGMPISAFFVPEARKGFAEALEAVFQGPERLEMTLLAESGYGKPALSARMLILPLASDLGDVNRALGCLISTGQIGRAPRRFRLGTLQRGQLVAGIPAAATLPDAAALQPGFAERPAGFAAAPATPPDSPEARRAMLRVVRSDD
jgi:hypothetical protein